MKRVLLFVQLAYCLAFPNGYPSNDEGERVVGGMNAPEGSAPYQASLRAKNMQHFCGASILSPIYLVTAAHCVVGGDTAFVVVGSHKLSEGGTTYNVSLTKAHEEYDSSSIRNDIAIVKVIEAMVFNDFVQPIKLMESQSVEDPLTLTGWGRTSYPGKISNDLQTLTFEKMEYDECRKRLALFNDVYETQICTSPRQGKGACHGDSGGPLVSQDMKLVGVVSWGLPCARGYPDVYTRVSSFVSWIRENAKEDEQLP